MTRGALAVFSLALARAPDMRPPSHALLLELSEAAERFARLVEPRGALPLPAQGFLPRAASRWAGRSRTLGWVHRSGAASCARACGVGGEPRPAIGVFP